MRIINTLPGNKVWSQITLAYNDSKLMEAWYYVRRKTQKDLQKIATRVMEDLDGILLVMQKAAEQISSGRALEEIDDAGYNLYLARKDPKDRGSRAEAVLCTWL